MCFLTIKIFKPLEYAINIPAEGSEAFIFVLFSSAMFFISFYGVASNKNHLIFSLVYLELMLFSISWNFIYFSVLVQDPRGQIFALLFLAIAVSEAVIGLTLLVASSHYKHNLKITNFNLLKG